MDLKELKDKIEKIEITNNYDECYIEDFNINTMKKEREEILKRFQ